MISDKMVEALNAQIAKEGYASFLYLSMATWCNYKGLKGCHEFLTRQAEEEHMHMLKIYDYLSDVDRFAITPGIEQPPHEFDSVQSLFKAVYEHEKEVTKSINELLSLANKENDFTTQSFLQWYVEEQREEEALMRTILDRMDLIGDGPQSLYFIDKEVEAINKRVSATEAGRGK